MTGTILYVPVMQFVDTDGEPEANATAQFYLTGTTTPSPAYQDADLTEPLTNPVVADDTGIFPPCYLDNNLVYRLVVKSADATRTILDADPVNALFSVGAANIEDGAIEEKLGYTPVDPDNAVFTSPARLTFTSPVTALHVDDVGFRNPPPNIKDSDYTFLLDDAGCLFIHDDTSNFTWTIPNNSTIAFPVGTQMFLSNQNTGTIALHRDTDVALRVAGAGTDDDVTINQYGFFILTQVAVDSWVVK